MKKKGVGFATEWLSTTQAQTSMNLYKSKKSKIYRIDCNHNLSSSPDTNMTKLQTNNRNDSIQS